MKKRIVILASVALALIAVLSLVACGGAKYTVTVNLAGGTGIEVTEIKVSEGGTISDPGTPTREGYRFIGWYIGDTPKAWDFENTKVTSDMTLRAAWSTTTSSDVCKDGGPHTFVVLEETKPDCKNGGRLRQKCTVCLTTITVPYNSLGHDILETVVEPTCGAQGYTNKRCVREGCDYDTTVAYIQPTGNHTWSGEASSEYEVVSAPTKYTPGVEKEWCLVCDAERTYRISPLYTPEDLAVLVIGNYTYTGGSYVNSPFVNISSYAGVTASSYYTVCVTNNAIDGDVNSYWGADTIADGANFTGEWLLLTFQEEREVGAINMVMPNYTAWELGEECYVEFNIELLVDGEWIKVGTISDKAGRTEGLNAGCMLELPTPYKTNAVRATVSHSTRFSPAIVYELEVFAHTKETYREPISLDGSSTVAVTGKYNEWASGGGSLTDGDPNSYWWTDWRQRTFEFANLDLSFVDSNGNTAIRKITEITFTADKLIGEKFRVRYYGLNASGSSVDWNVISFNGKEWSTIQETDSEVVIFTVKLDTPIYATRLVIECDGYTPEGELIDFNYHKPTLKDVSFKYHDVTLKKGVEIPTTIETVDADGNKKTVNRSAADIFKDKINPENADESSELVDEQKNVEVAYYDAVYAELEFPVETFVAAVQFATRADKGRSFSLQYWVVDEEHPDGHFVEVGKFTVPEYGDTSVDCIYGTAADGKNTVNTVAFTQNLEVITLKIRLEIIKEPAYWESKIFSLTPYTIEEKAVGVIAYSGCKHTILHRGEVVAPTCVDAGYTIMNCNCGYTSKSKATDALGHTWGEYIAVADASTGGASTRTSTCSDCGATKTKQYNSDNPIVEITQYLKNAPAAWSHTLDDGNYMDTYEWAVPVFQKYKYRATMVMAITFAEGFVPEWQEYFSNSGVFDLGSHSYNHEGIYNVGSISEASLLNDVNRAHYWFMNKFKGQRLLGFATPNGQTSEAAADYLAGFYYAARVGDSSVSYNLPSELINRVKWGRLNSYVSKSNQTEGDYTYVKKSEIESLINTLQANSDKNVFINYVFNEETLRLEDNDRYDGTYWYNAETYVYEWLSEGSYTMHIEQETVIEKVKETVVDPETGEEKEVEVEKEVTVDKEVYTFVNDNSGDYIMVHSELGSYEKGINTALDVGGWVIDCVHSFGSGSIWSSYNSTISKFEYMKKTHVWGASYTDAIQYLREYQNAHVDVTEMTDTVIKISLTDTLDDYMFNHALTVKVDIPDEWTNVTVTQNGIEIPLIMDVDEYYDDFAREACIIIDGYLYLDAVPDAGEIVVTVAE